VLAKRLEDGVFAVPLEGSARVELTIDDMEALLSGMDFQQAGRRKRYRHHAASAG
jgi:hypothetical protein